MKSVRRIQSFLVPASLIILLSPMSASARIGYSPQECQADYSYKSGEVESLPLSHPAISSFLTKERDNTAVKFESGKDVIIILFWRNKAVMEWHFIKDGSELSAKWIDELRGDYGQSGWKIETSRNGTISYENQGAGLTFTYGRCYIAPYGSRHVLRIISHSYVQAHEVEFSADSGGYYTANNQIPVYSRPDLAGLVGTMEKGQRFQIVPYGEAEKDIGQRAGRPLQALADTPLNGSKEPGRTVGYIATKDVSGATRDWKFLP